MGRPHPIVCLGKRIYEARSFDIPTHFAGDALMLSDVAVLGNQVIALRRTSPELLVFDLEGHFLKAVAISNVVCGHGLRRINDQHLALVDMDGHKVVILNDALEIELLLSKDGLPCHEGPFNHPTDCTQSPDGRYFVSDGYGNSCVHIFDPAGDHIKSFGEPGIGCGKFSTPHAISIDPNERLYVADRENNRVQKFTLDGQYLCEIIGLYKPMALDFSPDGRLLVTDQTPRLSIYDDQGFLTGRCRTFGTFGHGIASHSNGSLYIAEMLPAFIRGLYPT